MRGRKPGSIKKKGGRAGRGEEGFTLVEALISIVVLAFGLVAITNLLIAATLSNSRASSNSAAAAVASQYMEQLKAIPVTGTANALDVLCAAASGPPWGDLDNNVANFNATDNLPGVGNVLTRWMITSPAAAVTTYMITVRSEVQRPIAGAAARAEFTAVRVVADQASP
jgi:type II secretory pathway pseudopilin PulG